MGVTRVPGPDPGGGTGCPGDEERTERGDEERTEEKGGGGKEQEGDVGRDNFGELFWGQVCPLWVGKRNTQRAYLPQEKFTKIVLHPGGGFLRPDAEGVSNCIQPVSEGTRGKHHPRRAGRGKVTRHHTTPHPFQTTPDRTTTHQSPTRRHSTPHLTTPGTQQHHTWHHSKHNSNRSPPFLKTLVFHQKMHLFEIAPKPGPKRPPTQPPPPDAASFWNAGTPLFLNNDVALYVGVKKPTCKAQQPP